MGIRGGGANSIHIDGNSEISNLIIEKTDDGSIRVVTSDGTVVKATIVEDGSDDIILTGAFESVTIAADVTVNAVDASIDAVEISGENASFDVDENSTVTAVTVSDTANGTTVTVSGTVGTLTTDAQISVTNSGTITTAVVNADNVIIDGNEPKTVEVDESVTVEPANSDGTTVDGTTSSSSSGSSGGSSSSPAAATVSSAETSDATTIVLTMSSALTGTAGDPAAFTVAGAASSPSVSSVAVR